MDAQQPAVSYHYTFDTPSHVMDDFCSSYEDNADRWFDLMAAPKNGEIEQLVTPLRTPKPFDGMYNEDLVHVAETTTSTNVVPEGTAPEPVSNIVTPRGDDRLTGAPSQAQKNNAPAQPRRILKHSMAKDEPQAPTSPPVMKKRRSSTRAKQARLSRAAATRRQKSKPARPSAAASASTASANQQKSTERIETLQKEVAEQRKRNEASYRAALAGKHPEASYKESDFPAQLRKHLSSPLKAHKGTTVPKPFNLSTGRKRKLDESSTYVSMAQQIEQFQKRTPTRYLRSRQSQKKVSQGFQLSTEHRAKERLEFEQALKEKESLRVQMEERRAREQEEREKEEITRLRREQVHKAQPIRHYKPVVLKRSEMSLTVPKSPNFSRRFRL